MFVISNSTNDKPSIITTISLDTIIILLVVCFFLAAKNAKFEVL